LSPIRRSFADTCQSGVVDLVGMSLLQQGVSRSLERLGMKQWLRSRLAGVLSLAGSERPAVRAALLYQSLRRLAASNENPTDGPKVLIISFRGAWLLHTTWEALIAEGIRRRGGSPTILTCSGGLPEALPGRSPACGIANVHVTRPASCSECTRCGLSVAGALDLPILQLREFVGVSRVRELTEKVDSLPVSAIPNLEHHGIPVGRLVLNSSRWFLCASELDGDADAQSVLRSFAKSGLIVAELAPLLMDRVQPDVVFLLNGLFFAERILAEEARLRGIRVVTYEHGFLTDTICCSEDIAGYCDISSLWKGVRDVPLTEEQDRRLDEYMLARSRGLGAPFNYWPTVTESESQIIEALDIDPRLPTAVLFTNVTWDSAVQDRHRFFDSMIAWILDTVNQFATRPETQLVIRVHPAEVILPYLETRDSVLDHLKRALPSLPKNVRVVAPDNDLSSYTLMRLAHCGLVYTSTVGLEMAMQGIPVVVAGETHYRGKGFTIDPSTREQYAALVWEALGQSRDTAVRDRARRYAYALFFRYFLPFDLVSENPPLFIPTARTSDPTRLDPGGDATMDLICEGILRGADVYGNG